MYHNVPVPDVHGHVSVPFSANSFLVLMMGSNTPMGSPIGQQAAGPARVTPEEFRSAAEGHVRYMDERNIDVQVIGPRPFLMMGWMEPHLLPAWTGYVNDMIHQQCAFFPGRFLGACMLPQISDAPDPGNCIGELDRCAGEYGFVAAYASPDPAGRRTTPSAPSYHRRYWSPEHSSGAYRDCEEFLADIRDYQREVVRDLVALGCDYIQLDAPNYGSLCDPDTRARMTAEGRDPDAETAFDAELDNSLFDGADGITTALHICRGNGPGGAWHSAGGYGAISRQLFPRLTFSRLLLEYDSDRAGTFEPLADVRPGTVVVLGLLTTKSDQLDDEADISARIEEAARLKPLGELALSTQCGFASVPGGNPVSPAGQRAKLELVARLANRSWPG